MFSFGFQILDNYESTVFDYDWEKYFSRKGKGDDISICGGSLIDSRRILTAAHCALDDDDNEVPVEDIRPYLGLQSVEEADTTIKAAKVSYYEVNPHYPKYNGYDIALIVLEKPVKFTKTISPICIPAFGSKLKDKKFTVVGWGDSHLEPDRNNPEKMISMTPTVPMEAEVDFVSSESHHFHVYLYLLLLFQKILNFNQQRKTAPTCITSEEKVFPKMLMLHVKFVQTISIPMLMLVPETVVDH